MVQLDGAAGGVKRPACAGMAGNNTAAQANGAVFYLGPGGGGNATMGGVGGVVDDGSGAVGRTGGATTGADELVQLEGGCSERRLFTNSSNTAENYSYGELGGGA